MIVCICRVSCVENIVIWNNGYIEQVFNEKDACSGGGGGWDLILSRKVHVTCLRTSESCDHLEYCRPVFLIKTPSPENIHRRNISTVDLGKVPPGRNTSASNTSTSTSGNILAGKLLGAENSSCYTGRPSLNIKYMIVHCACILAAFQ